MSSENNRTNFIKNIIKDDLASGKHDSIITRFHQSQTDIYI